MDSDSDSETLPNQNSSASGSVCKAPSGNVSHESSRCKSKHLINFGDELNPSSPSSKNSFISANGSSVTNPICLDEEMDCHLFTVVAGGLKQSNLSANIDDTEDHTMMIDESISIQNYSKSPLLEAVSATKITCSFAQGLASELTQSNLSNFNDDEEDRIMENETITSPTNLTSPLLKASCVNDHKCPFAQGLQAKPIVQSVASPKGSLPCGERTMLASPRKKTKFNSSQNSSTGKSVTSISKKRKKDLEKLRSIITKMSGVDTSKGQFVNNDSTKFEVFANGTIHVLPSEDGLDGHDRMNYNIDEESSFGDQSSINISDLSASSASAHCNPSKINSPDVSGLVNNDVGDDTTNDLNSIKQMGSHVLHDQAFFDNRFANMTTNEIANDLVFVPKVEYESQAIGILYRFDKLVPADLESAQAMILIHRNPKTQIYQVPYLSK